MDEIIYYFYHNGFYLLVILGAIKVLLILLYRGFDLAYLFENFLVIYSSPGIEPSEKRKKFRTLHNIVTITFYIVLLLWIAISAVVRYAD